VHARKVAERAEAVRKASDIDLPRPEAAREIEHRIAHPVRIPAGVHLEQLDVGTLGVEHRMLNQALRDAIAVHEPRIEGRERRRRTSSPAGAKRGSNGGGVGAWNRARQSTRWFRRPSMTSS
jgi:hypothetical protein